MTTKSIKKYQTPGVIDLNLNPIVLQTIMLKAEHLMNESTFLSFKPKGTQLVIEDGNNNELESLNITIPEKLWIVFDDYGTHWVQTALLPDEY